MRKVIVVILTSITMLFVGMASAAELNDNTFMFYVKRKPFDGEPMTPANGVITTVTESDKSTGAVLALGFKKYPESRYNKGYPWYLLNATGEDLCNVYVAMRDNDTVYKIRIGNLDKGQFYDGHGEVGQYRSIAFQVCGKKQWYMSDEDMTTIGATVLYKKGREFESLIDATFMYKSMGAL